MLRILSAALALAMLPIAANAQDAANWPRQPVQLLVPFPAGTTTDLVARIVANDMSERLGQPVVDENRPGGSGAIAMEAVATADPDGYTIGLGTTTTQTVAVSMNPNLPYDPETDFEPIAMVGGVPYVLVVSPSLGVTSFEDLVAKAKEDPGALTYGSVGEASLANLSTLLLANLTGMELTHVPYTAAGQVALDNVAGRIDMQLSTYGSLQAFMQEDQLIPLAVTSRQSLSQLPDTPPVSETGLADYEALLWFAMVAPAGTPDDLVLKMNEAINAGLETDAVRDALLQQGVEPDPNTPDYLATRITEDIAKWREVRDRAGIDAE